ncbi:sugar transferase [Massilibacteroides sp.]|uniref:sugar transferase n=1 Tax=Massilibacteroides sp. TaxID=2034766 RepID=UPI0026141076|nr:sugar transferase [Massilibacteroides sp.]MDD4514739.1 sugar transferase [Massilibacteroides sp.]
MKVKTIYIGKQQVYIQHFEQLFHTESEGRLDLAENHVAALNLINDYYPKVPVIIFYEQDTVKIDCERIQFLHKKFTHLYIILITKGLNSEEKLSYIKSGVNDTAAPDVKLQIIRDFLDWINEHNSLLNHPHVEKEDLVPFVIPKLKRLFDITVSLLTLIFLSPLFLIISLAIRIESKGPIIYKSKRVGSNYKIFDFWKFRSMYVDADKRLKEYEALNQYKTMPIENPISTSNEKTYHNQTFLVSDDEIIPEEEYIKHKRIETENAFKKLEDDPRITKVGHFIRKYSIDELPQLINILKGDMSIVGNRPLPLYEAEALTGDESIERFLAPAGLTGLWQVEKRGDSGSLSAKERKDLDIYYARNYSPLMDFRIILKTFKAFIQKEDV